MKNCMRWPLTGLVLSLMVMFTSSAARAEEREEAEECDGVTLTASLVTLNSSGVTGTATMCISESGIHTRIKANSLIPGRPYTVWFVYYDDPTECMVSGHCTPADTVSPLANPEGVLGRYDSIIARASTGKFSGHVGLQPSRGSVIVIPIFAHGALSADGHIRARQLLTPQDPTLGAPGLGTSSDGNIGAPVARAAFVVP